MIPSSYKKNLSKFQSVIALLVLCLVLSLLTDKIFYCCQWGQCTPAGSRKCLYCHRHDTYCTYRRN